MKKAYLKRDATTTELVMGAILAMWGVKIELASFRTISPIREYSDSIKPRLTLVNYFIKARDNTMSVDAMAVFTVMDNLYNKNLLSCVAYEVNNMCIVPRNNASVAKIIEAIISLLKDDKFITKTSCRVARQVVGKKVIY